MPDAIYILVQFISYAIEIITLAMLIRAVISWFYDGDGAFVRLLYFITEPIIMPIRLLLVKMNWLQQSPLDFAYLLTYVVLFLIRFALGMLF